MTTPFPGCWRVFPHPASGDHIVTAGASARKSRSISQRLSLLLGPLRGNGRQTVGVLKETLPNTRHVAVHEIEGVLAQTGTDLAVAEAIGLKAQLFEARRPDE